MSEGDREVVMGVEPEWRKAEGHARRNRWLTKEKKKAIEEKFEELLDGYSRKKKAKRPITIIIYTVENLYIGGE